jgi:hypothetical protein
MAYPLSEFHEGMRVILGDEGDVSEGYDYLDSQLNAALRTVIRMGRVPGVVLTPTDPGSLVSAPANPDTWGFLVASAARLMMSGQEDVNFRTRALSVTADSFGRENRINRVDQLLADLDAGGNVGGTAEDITHKGLFQSSGDVITSLGFCLPAVDPLISPCPCP